MVFYLLFNCYNLIIFLYLTYISICYHIIIYYATSIVNCELYFKKLNLLQGSKKGKRKSISEDELQCIAIGTTSGKVLIYSVAQAKVETVLSIHKNNEQHSKKVQSVDWHQNYGLFSCSSDNIVYEWNLQSSNVRNKYNINVASNNKQSSKVSSIKLIPHNQVRYFLVLFNF